MTIDKEIRTYYNQHLAATGMALPDGSFVIRNRAELREAVKKWPKAKDPEAAKKHIIARANALRAADELPTAWIRDHASKSPAFEQAKAVIAKFAQVEAVEEFAKPGAASSKPGPLQTINKLLADPQFPEIIKARRNANITSVAGIVKYGSPAQKAALSKALHAPVIDTAVAAVTNALADHVAELEARIRHLEGQPAPRVKRAPLTRAEQKAAQVRQLREAAADVRDPAQRAAMLELADRMADGQ